MSQFHSNYRNTERHSDYRVTALRAQKAGSTRPPFLSMKKRHRAVLIVCLLLSALTGVLAYRSGVRPVALSESPRPGPANDVPVVYPVTPVMPDLAMLGAHMGQGGVLSLTPEQAAEHRQMEQEQLAAALEWLQSHDSEDRVRGAEQLGAYLTPQAQKALADVLSHDTSPDVRLAAANSLAACQSPDQGTIHSLVLAIRDANEDIRQSALAALESYLGLPDLSAPRRQQIVKAVTRLSKARNLDRETRASLLHLLEQF